MGTRGVCAGQGEVVGEKVLRNCGELKSTALRILRNFFTPSLRQRKKNQMFAHSRRRITSLGLHKNTADNCTKTQSWPKPRTGNRQMRWSAP